MYVLLDARPVATAVGEFALENVIPVEGDTVHVPVSPLAGVFPLRYRGVLLQMA